MTGANEIWQAEQDRAETQRRADAASVQAATEKARAAVQRATEPKQKST